jgi:hypothetical protein
MEPKLTKNIHVLQPAEISFDGAVIPDPALKETLVSTSQAITESFEDRNIVDHETFPPHLSLHLAGTDQQSIAQLSVQLHTAIASFLSSQLIAEKLYQGTHGFIGVECAQNEVLMSLVHTVIKTCAILHRQSPRYRPRILERWKFLSGERRELLKSFGTDKLPHWKPHFSIAEVAEDNASQALHIARQFLPHPQSFTIQAIELVDVGHRNECWNVLSRWS